LGIGNASPEDRTHVDRLCRSYAISIWHHTPEGHNPRALALRARAFPSPSTGCGFWGVLPRVYIMIWKWCGTGARFAAYRN